MTGTQEGYNHRMARVNIIAALGKNRELGKDSQLLWHIPDDLKRFKRLTLGHPVIMGRKTFDSIGKALPGRANIVITGDAGWRALGVNAVHSLQEAIDKAKRLDQQEVFIIGGAQIYKEALQYADTLYLTQIDAEAPADAFFPPYGDMFTKKVFEEAHESNGVKYTWVDLER